MKIKYIRIPIPYISLLSIYRFFKHLKKDEIFVQFGEITKALVDVSIKKGTVLNEFRISQGVECFECCRVNEKQKGPFYKLQYGDIVTTFAPLRGG